MRVHCSRPWFALRRRQHDECGGCPLDARYACAPGAPGWIDDFESALENAIVSGRLDDESTDEQKSTRRPPPEHHLSQLEALTSSVWPLLAAESPSDRPRGFLVGAVNSEFARVQVVCPSQSRLSSANSSLSWTQSDSANNDVDESNVAVVQRLDEN